MPLYTDTTYPGWPQKPATDDAEGDPMQALQALLSGSSQAYPDASSSGVGNRNSAVAGALRQKYGLGPDRGDISQSDLESLDSFVRGADTADKLAPIQAQGKIAAAAEEQKAKDAADLENIKGQYGLQGEAMKAQALRDVADTKGQSALDVAGVKGGKSKLSNQEQATLDATHAIFNLGQPLLQKFQQRYQGIDADPSKYGSPTDALTAKFGKGWYSFGGMTDNDELFQDSAAIQAWGMRQLAQGRINKSMMDIINAHLPQPGYSPGANYDRLKRLMTQVLPAQIQGIGQAQEFDPNNPMAGFGGAPSAGKYLSTDENYGQ